MEIKWGKFHSLDDYTCELCELPEWYCICEKPETTDTTLQLNMITKDQFDALYDRDNLGGSD